MNRDEIVHMVNNHPMVIAQFGFEAVVQKPPATAAYPFGFIQSFKKGSLIIELRTKIGFTKLGMMTGAVITALAPWFQFSSARLSEPEGVNVAILYFGKNDGGRSQLR